MPPPSKKTAVPVNPFMHTISISSYEPDQGVLDSVMHHVPEPEHTKPLEKLKRELFKRMKK